MKRPLVLVIIAVILVGLILIVLSDTNIYLADTSIPDNKIITGQTKASNSSAIAMIMIAWTAPSGEGGSNEL